MNSWKKPLILLFACILVLSLIGISGCVPSGYREAAVHYNQGNALLNQDKYDEAIVEYNQALEHDSTFASAYYNRGVAYFNKLEWDLAIADFTKAIELDPGDPDAYFNRGLAYEIKEQNNLAIADYDKVLKLSKDANLTQKAANRIGNLNQTASGTIPNVQIFPSQVTVDLDWPVLLLRADVNSLAIEANSEKYSVEWYYNHKLISTESCLTEEPFINAIHNQKGTYTIDLVVKDKATGAVGTAHSIVIAEKQEPIIIAVNHWVSAIPGEGLKIWKVTLEQTWWGYDVDLRIVGNTGTLTSTLMTFSPSVPQELREGVGEAHTTSIENAKDDGTNIEFYFINGATTVTFQLTRTTDGHLKGSYHLVDKGGETWSPSEWAGTVDLVPAP